MGKMKYATCDTTSYTQSDYLEGVFLNILKNFRTCNTSRGRMVKVAEKNTMHFDIKNLT